MSKKDRETLLKLARFLESSPSKKRVQIPAEVLQGIARTLQGMAQKQGG